MDINVRFRKILIENRVISNASYDKAAVLLKRLQIEKEHGTKIGLYGVGIETEGLMQFIIDNISNFTIDKCFDKTIRSYEHKSIILDSQVYPIENIIDMNIGYLILGSYRYRHIFVENLKEIGYKGEVVDLYAYMEEYIQNTYADHEMGYKARQEYLCADENDKLERLRKLIKEYLLLKDFRNAYKCMDEYIEKEYLYYEQYKKLREDLNQLFSEIKDYITKRNRKDIIINWVDALSYYDIPKFPFLQQKGKEGVFFENAYTVMPWTTETTKTILTGEYPIEGQLFLKNDFSMDNMQLLKILEAEGYEFGYCGMPKFAKCFDDTVITPFCYFENKYSASMQKQWDALTVLCENDKTMCILIHTLRETHEPFACVNGDTLQWFGSTARDWEQEACRKQAAIAGMYINDQLEFYESFYGDNAVKIYMSDHGRIGNSPMNDNKIHIMLSVCGKDIERKSVGKMFSLVQFPSLIKKIICEENDWDALTEEYVLIENYDAYSELSVRDTLSNRLNRDEMYQCRGVVTLKDRYYLYAYGKEFYFAGRGSDKNEIENVIYKDRVDELRKICGDRFINIYQHDKFKHSRQLYTDFNIDLTKYNFK